MTISSRAFRAMCFLAWSAYFWLGPGSSEAVRLMAAWASVMTVTRSGVRYLHKANSSAHLRAARSVS